jgi:hypothetical protein
VLVCPRQSPPPPPAAPNSTSPSPSDPLAAFSHSTAGVPLPRLARSSTFVEAHLPSPVFLHGLHMNTEHDAGGGASFVRTCFNGLNALSGEFWAPSVGVPEAATAPGPGMSHQLEGETQGSSGPKARSSPSPPSPPSSSPSRGDLTQVRPFPFVSQVWGGSAGPWRLLPGDGGVGGGRGQL